MAHQKLTFKTANNFVLALIILVNGYVIVAPFVPSILFHIESHTGRQQQLTKQITSVAKSITSAAPAVAAQPNHVVIPSMLLDQNILEGPIAQTYNILDKGVWRYPKGSTPDKGGNTVLIGHRFTYTNPRGVFYFLNKVNLGDTIGIFWNNHLYTYKVSSINVVPPTDTAIEDATTTSQVTIFTCTPLFLPKDRLVVVAQLENS